MCEIAGSIATVILTTSGGIILGGVKVGNYYAWTHAHSHAHVHTCAHVHIHIYTYRYTYTCTPSNNDHYIKLNKGILVKLIENKFVSAVWMNT